jgi:hypothetical protein
VEDSPLDHFVRNMLGLGITLALVVLLMWLTKIGVLKRSPPPDGEHNTWKFTYLGWKSVPKTPTHICERCGAPFYIVGEKHDYECNALLGKKNTPSKPPPC